MRPKLRLSALLPALLWSVASILLPSPLRADAAPAIARESLLLLEPAAAGAASSYSAALRTSLARALKEAGFSVASGAAGFSPRASEGEEASALAIAAGSAWVACSVVSINGYRLSYRIAVYESESSGLVAADSFTAVAGLGALPLIDESASRVAAKASAALRGLAASRRVVGYRITLASPDEGATVSMDSSVATAAFPLGSVEGGNLELPYYPFVAGDKITLTVSAPARRSQIVELTLGEEPPLVQVPALPLSARKAFYLDSGTGRLLGAGAGFRLYAEPDWWYLFVEDRLFAGVDFSPGSSPLLHDEFWSGLGWYLVRPPEKRLRFGLQVGMGILGSLATGSLASRRAFLDYALRPVDLFAEWNLNSTNAIRLGLGASYSFGSGSAGLLGRGWIGNGRPALSLGWAWER